ncbi:MAG: DUF5672 family protein [Bacteroidota bacterium]
MEATNKKTNSRQPSVVILIITHKPQLHDYEQISIKQCYRILGNYPIVFVCPDDLDTSFYQETFPNCDIHCIPPKWQKNYKQFARLKMSPLLYEHYKSYEYILFYEPDAFVFKDKMDYWCSLGYSYIGAPWFMGMSDAKENAAFLGVGNGGFSLRKIEDHLKVIYSHKRIFYKRDFWLFWNWSRNKPLQILKFFYRYIVGNSTYHHLNNFQWGEDRFWGLYVSRAFEWFTTPPLEVARKFSIETLPNKLYKDNNQQLPFGCHAWWRYDLEFWRPHIEEFGYDLGENDLQNKDSEQVFPQNFGH